MFLPLKLGPLPSPAEQIFNLKFTFILRKQVMLSLSSLITIVFGAPKENSLETSGWLKQPIIASDQIRTEISEYIQKLIPPLNVPDRITWEHQASNLRQEILDRVVFRGVPQEWVNWKARTVWGDILKAGPGYQIRKLRYQALPGLWIPALLYEPTQAQAKIPAILNVNGHVGPPGKSTEYEQLRCINLAKKGVLALHPEWFYFGELAGEDYKHNRMAYLDLCGVSGLSTFYLAMRGGLDVLCDYPSTDLNRVGMTGLSGGGWQTIILSALDERISLSAPNAGYIDLKNRIDYRSDIGDLEQNPTDLVSIADYTYLTGMLAPRPTLLLYNQKDDCCFVAKRAELAVYYPTIPFFQLFARTTDFVYYENKNPGTHNYDLDNREQFYRFVKKHYVLLDSTNAEIPSETELLTAEQLTVGLPEGNANFFTLAKNCLDSLPKYPVPTTGNTERRQWQEAARTRLHQVLCLSPLVDDGITADQLNRRESANSVTIEEYQLMTESQLTLPLLVLSPEQPQHRDIVIAIADKGRTQMEDWIHKEVSLGNTVITVDLLFMGESIPAGISPWQYAMLIATVGQRPLGIQVRQLQVLIEWVCQKYQVSQVSLQSQGWNSGIAALATSGLSPKRIKAINATDALIDLKILVEQHFDYEDYPALFCFGLLEEFNVPELMALSSRVKTRYAR